MTEPSPSSTLILRTSRQFVSQWCELALTPEPDGAVCRDTGPPERPAAALLCALGALHLQAARLRRELQRLRVRLVGEPAGPASSGTDLDQLQFVVASGLLDAARAGIVDTLRRAPLLGEVRLALQLVRALSCADYVPAEPVGDAVPTGDRRARPREPAGVERRRAAPASAEILELPVYGRRADDRLFFGVALAPAHLGALEGRIETLAGECRALGDRLAR